LYAPFHMFGQGTLGFTSISGYAAILHETFVDMSPGPPSWAQVPGITCISVPLAVVGLFCRGGEVSNRWLFHWWLAGFVLFALVTGDGYHPWYYLPLIPAVSALAGIGLERGTRHHKWLVLVPVVVAQVLLSLNIVQGLREPGKVWLLAAAHKVQQLTPSGAVVAVTESGDPTLLYYAQRHGRHFSHEQLFAGEPLDSQDAIGMLERLRREGVTHLVLTTPRFWWLDYYRDFATHLRNRYRLLAKTEDCALYDLTAPPGEHAAGSQ
jgi:hypothetical protein